MAPEQKQEVVKMTSARSLENTIKSMMYEDQAYIGTYRTKNFDVAPEALNLYSKNFDKKADAHYGEKMAIFQDQLFDIVRKGRKSGFYTPSDKSFSKELKKKIDYLADLVGMTGEHSYVQKYVDEIHGEKPSMTDFEEPSSPTYKKIDNTGDDYHLSRNKKAQHRMKIIDEQKKPFKTLESTIRELLDEGVRAGYNPTFTSSGAVPATRLKAHNDDVKPVAKKTTTTNSADHWHKNRIETKDGSSLTHSSAYEDYCDHCEKHGHSIMPLTQFVNSVKDKGVVSQKIAGRSRFIGIDLKAGDVNESLKEVPKQPYRAPSNLDGIHDRIREFMKAHKGKPIGIDKETKDFHYAVFQGRIDNANAAMNRRQKMEVATRTSKFDIENRKVKLKPRSDDNK